MDWERMWVAAMRGSWETVGLRVREATPAGGSSIIIILSVPED